MKNLLYKLEIFPHKLYNIITEHGFMKKFSKKRLL